jgi:hypothetical protein
MSPTDTTIQILASTNLPSAGVSHENVELQSIATAAVRDRGRVLGNEGSSGIDPIEFLPQPSTTVSVVERWNHPMVNVYRTFSILFAFILMGANDAVYGVSSTIFSI